MNPTAESITLEPFFLKGSAGRLFCIYHGPGGAAENGILLIPPFAEEMNKARRQAALQARAFAARGFGVLLMDLYGTGESEGNFGDARWETWCDDLLRGARWLEQRGIDALLLWGIRAGALLATDLLASLSRRPAHLLFWQPVASGRSHISQFLRLRVAADMIAGDKQGSTREMLLELERGVPVEVAGYELHPELVREMSGRELAKADTSLMPDVSWLEITPGQDRPVTPVSRRVIEAWQTAGVGVETETVQGEPFWTTPEISVVPVLIDRSCRRIADATG